MQTLEERLEALERALSTIKAEQIPDIRQLEERISVLQQQVAEQRKRISEHEQGIQQTLVRGTTLLTQHFTSLDARFSRLEQQIDARFDAQTTALRAQFEETNVAVTTVTVTAGQQGQDIRTIKEDIRGLSDRFDVQEGKLDQILERLQ
jgi:predicted  nucleic acid-binding Zn-ribbon protein